VIASIVASLLVLAFAVLVIAAALRSRRSRVYRLTATSLPSADIARMLATFSKRAPVIHEATWVPNGEEQSQ
jgi:hypothetical protein